MTSTIPRAPRGWRPWRRITVAEISAAQGETATPPPKLELGLPGPLQTRRTTAMPTPPRRIRPPDLLAEEQGAQLYGARWFDRGNIRIGRLAVPAVAPPAGSNASLRLELDFDASSVVIFSLNTARLVVGIGAPEASTVNAVGIVPANGWASIPLGGARVITVTTIAGVNVDGQVIVTAVDRMLPAGAGAL